MLAPQDVDNGRCQCRCQIGENFLYLFKAARRAARAAASARSPSLPLALPLRGANVGRLARNAQTQAA
jgi:hypothetical protein